MNGPRAQPGRGTTLVVALTVLSAWPSGHLAAQAPDGAAVMKGAEQAYRRLTSYQAEFRQTIENPMLGGPEQSRGLLFLKPPNQFAMRFTTPAGERIVADGRWLWIYAPSTAPGQVIRQPVPASGAATPNFFAQFLERPLERYAVGVLGVDTIAGVITDVVRLLPRVSGLPFREAVIALARSDSLPRRLLLVEDTQRRTIVLDQPIRNANVPAAELTFTPGRGTRVITP